MKKLSYLVVLLTMLVIQSCSKKTDSGSSNNTAKSLTISASKNTVWADGYDDVTLTVKDNNGLDVTNSVTILQNRNVTFSNQVFEYGTHGTYKYTATNGSVTSNEIIITVADPGNAKFTTKVIAEDCTGTWCGWCPRITHKFDQFMSRYTNLYTVGVHNADVFAISSLESALRNKFNITGFPSAIINRDVKFADNGNINSLTDSASLVPYMRKRAVTGLAINSTVNGTTLDITTKVKFDATIKYGLKLVVVVTEDGLVRGQTNYYNNNNSYPGNPYYSAGATITNFVHNGVLRGAPTGIFGVDIPLASQTKDNEYTNTQSFSLAGLVTANTKVVAYVVFADAQSKRGILNAQWAAAGTNKNYD